MVIGRAVQGIQGAADLRRGVAACLQERFEQAFLNVAIASAVALVAQFVVAQFVAEQGNHSVLRNSLGFSDVAHGFFPRCKAV